MPKRTTKQDKPQPTFIGQQLQKGWAKATKPTKKKFKNQNAWQQTCTVARGVGATGRAVKGAAGDAKRAGQAVRHAASKDGISDAAKKFYGSRFGRAVDKADRAIGGAAKRLVGQRKAQVTEHKRTLPNGETIIVAANGMTKGQEVATGRKLPARQRTQTGRKAASTTLTAQPRKPTTMSSKPRHNLPPLNPTHAPDGSEWTAADFAAPGQKPMPAKMPSAPSPRPIGPKTREWMAEREERNQKDIENEWQEKAQNAVDSGRRYSQEDLRRAISTDSRDVPVILRARELDRRKDDNAKMYGWPDDWRTHPQLGGAGLDPDKDWHRVKITRGPA